MAKKTTEKKAKPVKKEITLEDRLNKKLTKKEEFKFLLYKRMFDAIPFKEVEVTNNRHRYKNTADLNKDILDYLKYLILSGENPSKFGLSLYLGIGRQTLVEYKSTVLSNSIITYEEIVEHHWVNKLGQAHATGSIFALKTQFGYKDNLTVDISEIPAVTINVALAKSKRVDGDGEK